MGKSEISVEPVGVPLPLYDEAGMAFLVKVFGRVKLGSL